jgi:capsular polysaccharide biosynthesis protein
MYPEGKNFVGEDIIFTDCPKKFGTTSQDVLRKLKNIVLEKCGANQEMAISRLVYVSRKKARGRKVLNEEAIERQLEKLGYEIFCFEDLSFTEQVVLMSEARVLVSIHGAALTNMIFMREGSSVVEIIPKKNGIFDYNIVRNSFKHDPCYVRLADAMGHRYNYVECKTDAPWHSGTHMANLTVDIENLLEVLKKIPC